MSPVHNPQSFQASGFPLTLSSFIRRFQGPIFPKGTNSEQMWWAEIGQTGLHTKWEAHPQDDYGYQWLEALEDVTVPPYQHPSPHQNLRYKCLKQVMNIMSNTRWVNQTCPLFAYLVIGSFNKHFLSPTCFPGIIHSTGNSLRIKHTCFLLTWN